MTGVHHHALPLIKMRATMPHLQKLFFNGEGICLCVDGCAQKKNWLDDKTTPSTPTKQNKINPFS
jgi:hypothetical protein